MSLFRLCALPLMVELAQVQAPVDPLAVPPGHPAVRSQAEPPSGRALLHQLDASPDLALREKTFEIASSIAKLYALHGRYKEAQRYFQEALGKTVQARALYLKFRKQAATTPPPPCQLTAESQVEAVAAESAARAKRGDLPNAVACAHEALGPALAAQAWMGNVQFLAGDSAAALATYEAVLQVDAEDPVALYGRAGVHFDQGNLKLAATELQGFLEHYGDSPRGPQARALLARAQGKADVPREALVLTPGTALMAPMAGQALAGTPPPPMSGMTAPPGMEAPAAGSSPPPLSPQLVDTMARTPRTPEFMAQLDANVKEAEKALVQGRYQDALDRYKQVMPYQPENGRFRAGMAWALVGLNRQPMADRIWAVALNSDSAALEQLGDMLAKQGDGKGAQALYAKLAQTNPQYAQQVGLQRKMK